MSPELLHNGQDGTDQAYDPRSTDVWAAGVMLVVALCGAFPFDHTQHHHRSMEEAEIDLWYLFFCFFSLSLYVYTHVYEDSGLHLSLSNQLQSVVAAVMLKVKATQWGLSSESVLAKEHAEFLCCLACCHDCYLSSELSG